MIQVAKCPFIKDPVTLFCIYTDTCDGPCDSIVDIPDDDKEVDE